MGRFYRPQPFLDQILTPRQRPWVALTWTRWRLNLLQQRKWRDVRALA